MILAIGILLLAFAWLANRVLLSAGVINPWFGSRADLFVVPPTLAGGICVLVSVCILALRHMP